MVTTPTSRPYGYEEVTSGALRAAVWADGEQDPEAEHHLREALEQLPLMTWSGAADGTCTFLSQRWADYTGIPCEPQLGWKWVEQIHPDDRESMLAAARLALGRVEDYRTQYRLRRHDGAYRWFAAHGRAIRDAHGKVVRWVGSCTDIHEERVATAALAAEHQLLERIIATAPGTFFVLRRSKDGVYSHPAASPAIEKLLGASDQQLAIDAGAAVDRIHPDDRARVQAEIEESARTLRPWTTEHRFMHAQDGELWLEPHALPVREPDGSVVWYGFLRDITLRKRAEASLRTTQAQLTAALEAGGMGIWTWDMEADRLWLDDAFLKLIGRRREDAPERSEDMFTLVHADDAPFVRARLGELRSDGEDSAFEYRILRGDGQVRWLSAMAHCRHDDATRGSRATLLHADVTAQKQAAELRLRSQKLEALGTLAGGIAHDFNNMLHAISGNTALALRALEPQHPARTLLEAVAMAGTRASDLVRRILAFSRPADPRNEVLNLQTVVSETLALVRAAVPASIDLRSELGPEPLYIDAEPSQIHQIVLNLATNAAHAIGPTHGLLQLRLEPAGEGASLAVPPELRSGRYAALHIMDSGCGMDAQILERIFDPFFTTKPVGEGTGLGLSVVHGIMKSLGGAVTVSSKRGRGTTFTLYFPLTKRRSRGSSRPPAAACEVRGARVLFVDDEPMLVELGVQALGTLGYDVAGRQRPRDALQDVLNDPARFDVLITDIAMPEMSGFDLARRVRARCAALPIIMISGNVGPRELAAAERLGIDEVLLKPVALETLSHALTKVLRRRAALASPGRSA